MARDQSESGLRYMGLGLELAAGVAGLALLGHWIDRHFGSAPWGLLAGAVIGLLGGMYNLIRAAVGGKSEPPPPGAGGDRGEGD